MNILEFLFSNAVFILLLLWLLSGFLGRKNSGEGGEESQSAPPTTSPAPQPARNRPTHQPDPTYPPVEKPWERVETPSNTQQGSAQGQQQSANPYEELLEQYREQQGENQERRREREQRERQRRRKQMDAVEVGLEEERSSSRHPGSLTKGHPAQSGSSRSLDSAVDFSQIDEKKVLQGMIWSEVLGTPRAKKRNPVQARYYR